MVPSGAPMIVTAKWDESLGTLYTALGGTKRISTRGSTRSDQALEGTRIWREKYEGLEFGPGVTPLFEIVYPSNRIVVAYRGMRDLVLLAVIDNATGADLPLERFDWPGPQARRRFRHSGGRMGRDSSPRLLSLAVILD